MKIKHSYEMDIIEINGVGRKYSFLRHKATGKVYAEVGNDIRALQSLLPEELKELFETPLNVKISLLTHLSK